MSTNVRKHKEPRQRRILRLAEVEAVTGKKRSTIYDNINAGLFPPPVPIGERAVGWLSDEVDEWLDGRVAERDEKRRAAETTTTA